METIKDFIGAKVGKFTIEDTYWNDENHSVIYTSMVKPTDNEDDDYCLEIFYNHKDNSISFGACYENEFVHIDENLDKYVTTEEVAEFTNIFKEIGKIEDYKEEDEEHFLSEDLYKLMTGEMSQADFITYWGTEISYQPTSASIFVYKNDEEHSVLVE